MRVIAINASRKRGHGPASLLLDPFLDGLREAGAEVDRFYTRDLLIRPRSRNLIGVAHTPCDRKARIGMRRLCRMLWRADVLVLASPLYCDGRTGPENATPVLRQLLEGLVPGTCMPAGSHEPVALREEDGHGKIVIASGSGFWEIDDGSLMLRGAMPRGLIDWDVIGTAREAGFELAQEATEPPTAHDIARQEIVTRNFYSRVMAGDVAITVTSGFRETCAQKED
jgi:hypothetical protein